MANNFFRFATKKKKNVLENEELLMIGCLIIWKYMK